MNRNTNFTLGENGLLVPPDEPVMLANAVRKLVQKLALAQKIRFAGLKTIREHCTLERIVDQTEEYLQMALQQTCSVSPRGD